MSSAPIDLFIRLARTGARANVEPDGWEHSVVVRFWRVDGSSLICKLEEVPDEDLARLAVGLDLWAVFESMGRVRTFTTRIEELLRQPDGTVAGLKCTLPDKVGSEDRRRAFRVPRVPPHALTVTLKQGPRAWRAKVINLSVVGVLLEFDDGVGSSLDDEAAYSLELKSLEGKATIGCRIVRRTRSGRVALRFPSSMRLGEVTPPPDLARVVRLCELIWLRKRNGRGRNVA